MNLRQPPALAVWLMDRLGYTLQNAALAGDLLEEYRNGRSRWWYWRQTIMVIANGVRRNAVTRQTYLKIVLVAFAAQAPMVFTLWRLQSPPRVHGAGAIVSALTLVLAAFVMAYRVKRSIPGNWAVLWDAFSFYPLAYCACALFAPRFSLGNLTVVELGWLAGQLTPDLVRVTNQGSAPAAEWPPGGTAALHEYVGHELALHVVLADGRTVVLRPDAIAEPAFLAADGELAAALFQGAATVELIRRAIWLGCARNYWPVLTNPTRTPAISVRNLAALVKETARTKRLDEASCTQFPRSPWKRVRDRFRLRAA